MRFDEPSQSFVIDDDFALPAKFFIKEGYTIPAHSTFRETTTYTRVMRCYFENRWGLSIIWGSMTYGTNKEHPYGHWKTGEVPEFNDEPDHVEVAIIMPEERHVPEHDYGDTLAELGSEWKGPTTIPAYDVEIWGEPLGYVDAEQLRFLVATVSRFDSHTWAQLDEGPYIETDDSGRYRLAYTLKGTVNDHDDAHQ